MRISKKIIVRIAVFLALFVLGNACFSFALRPYRSSGYEMWRGFKDKEKIEMVFAGSSQCLCDIDPSKVDDATGLSSYNMGTNMQSIQSSYMAIREAVIKKNVSAVVLLIDPDVMEMDRTDNFRAEQCFVRNLSDTENVFEKVKLAVSFCTLPEFIGKPYSVGYFFPWTYDRKTDVKLNISEKLEGQILDNADHRDANGYSGSDAVLNADSKTVTYEEAKAWSSEAGDLKVLSINEDNEKTLRKIADFCSENEVKLYAVTVPTRSTFAYYDYDGYENFKNRISEILSDYGVSYYDFNMIKNEYFDIFNMTQYRDNNHMNSRGAEKFSTLLGEYLMRLTKGQNVDDMFNS